MCKDGPIIEEPEDRIVTLLGFVLAHKEVDIALVGTQNPGHMTANIDIVENQLPIHNGVVKEIQRRFDENGESWTQLI